MHDETRIISPAQLDVIFVPGLAFSLSVERRDAEKNAREKSSREIIRLGRGGGFYDRLLAHPELRAKKIGVCFDAQIFPELPREPHDCLMDAVITETGIF